MNEKNFRFRLLIVFAVLITLSGGLYFFKNLFFSMSTTTHAFKQDLEDLRYLDQGLNLSLFALRGNLSLPDVEIVLNLKKVIEIKALMSEIRSDNPELKKTYTAITDFFDKKSSLVHLYLKNREQIKSSLQEMNSIFLEIKKNKINYTLDGKDFYRECFLDASLYLVNPNKNTDWKINENLKILSQITSFSKTNISSVENLQKKIELIYNSTKKMDEILQLTRDQSIEQKMKLIIKFEKEGLSKESITQLPFIAALFASIIILMLTIFFSFRNM